MEAVDPESLSDQVKDAERILKATGKPRCTLGRKNRGKVGMLEFITWRENQKENLIQSPVQAHQLRG